MIYPLIAEFTYKCRLCGNHFSACQSIKWEPGAVLFVIANALSEAVEPVKHRTTLTHCCDDGSLGIGDLLGAKKIVDKKPY